MKSLYIGEYEQLTSQRLGNQLIWHKNKYLPLSTRQPTAIFSRSRILGSLHTTTLEFAEVSKWYGNRMQVSHSTQTKLGPVEIPVFINDFVKLLFFYTKSKSGTRCRASELSTIFI